MTWHVLAQPGLPVPDGKSVLVYGLLVQDGVSVGSPNRAFWSIAVEAQLYVLLPLLLLTIRRLNAIAMVALVGAAVLSVGVMGSHLALAHTVLVQLTPDLAVLFAIGVLAAGVVTAGERTRSRPWSGYSLVSAIPVIVLIWVKGPAWSIANLFWVDLAWAPAIGCLLVAVATSRPGPLVGLLNTAPLRSLGAFSYSLYLTHLPIVIAVSYGLVLGRIPPGTPTFLVLSAALLPITVGFARLFAAVFELPFQRHGRWAPLRQAMSTRVQRGLRPGPSARTARPVAESRPRPHVKEIQVPADLWTGSRIHQVIAGPGRRTPAAKPGVKGSRRRINTVFLRR
jgi:peptidoglycan/LPS O-acetylase OafA/YrhL